MSEPQTCPKCGAKLPPDGRCPQCASESGPDDTEEASTIRLNLSTDVPGERIGPYKLLQLIGEGGMGSVWMAEQQHPYRRVALKLVKLGMDTKQVVARFHAEQQALALMDHPNIAKVYDVGATENGRPYFVMELVRGIPITEYCDKEKISTKERLDLFVQVCQSIQHAHQKGIIHRDIKPSNILVTMLDGVPVPKVIDFGIAKATQGKLVDETLFTAFEQFIGTPAYMSPEQAEMNALDIDTRSDIYSLGVLLYELLSGKTPFDTKRLLEAGLDEIRRVIREVEPPRPSTRISTLDAEEQTSVARQRHSEPPKLLGLIRGDLDWIVMKCLEKDRRRRYETANGLARDIERHLSNEPVVARPPSRLYRFQKTVKRNKLAFGAAGSIALALLVAVIVTSWQAILATRAQRTAVAERGKAEKARNEAEEARERARALRALAEHHAEEVRRNLYFAQMNLAGQSANSLGGLGRTAELLGLWRYTKSDLRGWEWYYLNGLCHPEMMTIRGDAYSVVWSPDGTRLASVCGGNCVKVFSAASGEERLILKGHTEEVNSVAWSPDNLRLASAGDDKTVRIWDAVNGRELHVLRGHADWVRSVVWSPDGRRLVSTGGDKTVRVWDSGAAKEIKVYARDVHACAWRADSTQLAFAVGKEPITLWDIVSGREQLVRDTFSDGILAVACSPDGRQLAFGGFTFNIYIVDSSTGEHATTLYGHGDAINSLSWNPTCNRLVSGSRDWTVRVWDVAASRQVASYRGHGGPIRSATWSPDGTRVASASTDGTVKLWDTGSSLKADLLRHQEQVTSVAWSPDGNEIASGNSDGTVRVWDRLTGDEVRKFRGHTSFVWSLAWDRNGTRLASCDAAGAVKIRDVTTGKESCSIAGHRDGSRAVAWSPDGRRLVSASYDRTAVVWDTESGKQLVIFGGHDSGVNSADWEPKGTRIVSGGADGLRLWDSASGVELSAIRHGHTATLRRVCWSPDATRLASASDDGLVKIWDVVTGKAILALRGHSGSVWSVAWSPDGSRLATGSWDKTVKVWDAVTGEQIGSLSGDGRMVEAVAWSQDGTQLAAATTDGRVGTVTIHDATLGYAVERSPQALPGLDRRLATDPQTPRCLMLRAETLASQGNWDKAATDIREYLGLPQNKGSRWYQTGWWVVGPYPESLKERYAPESNPDPSEPVNGASSQAEPSPPQLHWQPLPLEANTQLEFQTVLGNAEHISAYALRGIYSNGKQKLAFRVAANEPLRLWLNGKSIHERAATRQDPSGPEILPVTLEAGWNMLLVRVSHGTGAIDFSIGLSDQPLAPPSQSAN